MGFTLITGGAGYIGSNVTWAMREAGYSVVVIDDFSTGNRALLPNDVPVVEGSIGDIQLVRKVLREFRCGDVIHFAGSIISPESFAMPLQYYENNTSATRNLLEACILEGVRRFLFSSSAAVYGDAEMPLISEDEETHPISPYGASKLMSEWMLRDVGAAYGMNWAALRYFNVAGADASMRSGQVGPSSHLIKIATELAFGARDSMTIFGMDYDTSDGTCVRDYVHVSDLANAHVLLFDYLKNDHAPVIMNCGYGRGFSVLEVLRTVERVIGKSLNYIEGGRRNGDPHRLVADNSKILRALDWEPRYDDLTLIVESALRWEGHWRGKSHMNDLIR